MSFRKNLLSVFILPSLLLFGCGGGSDFQIGNGEGSLGGGSGGSSGGGSSGGGGGESTETSSTVSYYPLSVYEASADFSGFSQDGLFQISGQFPLITSFIINPINASSLASVDNAVASDYKVTVDDVEIDPEESFPLLQKLVGVPVQLKTAIVFDTSNSMNLTTEQFNALKTEAKNYIDIAKAHSDPIIANQKFVVWSFDEDALDRSNGFSDDAVVIKAAIDTVGRNIGSSSNLHRAIVKVIGRYVDEDNGINFNTDGPLQDPSLDFNNLSDVDDDLVDEVSEAGIFLTQIVLFSSGTDSKLEFDQAKMLQAIESQGFLKYGESSSNEEGGTFTKKPVFYYVTGGSSNGRVYQALSDVSESTVSLLPTEGAYTFSDDLILKQLSAIDERINLNNQYIYRYAFLPRQGEHVAVFSSKTEQNNYTLTSEYPAEYFTDNLLTDLGTPYQELSSLVEITGPNDEYLSLDRASLNEISTFRAATRWTTEVYDSSDYVWTLTGGVGVLNADGSYTISSISGSSATLNLENTTLGHSTSIVVTD